MSTPEKSGGASKRGSHRLAQVSQCERAWMFSWGHRLEPRKRSRPLVEGTAVHAVLAYQWASRMIDPPSWFSEVPLEAQLAEDTEGMPEAATLAKRVGEEYARHYVNDPWTPVAVEKEFFATVGDLRRQAQPGCAPMPDVDDERVSARIDLLIRVNGRLWAVDHKTTKNTSGPTLPRWYPDGEWAISFQFLLQTLILKKNFGADFAGVIVQRIKTTEPYDFDRNVVLLPPQVLADGAETVAKQVAHEMKLVAALRAHMGAGNPAETFMPPGNFWSCWSWGRPCDFRPLCVAEPQDRPAIVQLEYRRKDG